MIGLISCFVVLAVILGIFGGSSSAGNKQIVTLGVVCVIGVLYYLVYLLIVLFSKNEK